MSSTLTYGWKGTRGEMENAPGEVEWMIALLDDADDEPASVGGSWMADTRA